MKKKNLILCLALMLLAPVSANAQFGKLKNAVKKNVSSQSNNEFNNSPSEAEQRRKWAEMDAKKAAQDKQKQAQSAGKYKAALAKLSEEQRWAVEQLSNPTDAPDCPFMMDLGDKKSFPWEMNQVTGPLSTHSYLEKEHLMGLSVDSVQHQKAQMDARYAYNNRMLAALEGLKLSEYAEDYNKLEWAKTKIKGENVYYQCVPEMLSEDLLVSFSEFKIVKTANGDYAPTKGAILSPFCKGHPVQFDTKDNKFKFFIYKKYSTYIDEDEVKRQEQSLGYLRNVAALLSDRDPSKQTELFYKAALAEHVLSRALANNSKDNITYKERPKGSALNTPELRAEALKVLQKRFPGAGYEEVIVTGDQWHYVYNIFGIAIERYVFVAAVKDGGIAKRIIYLSVGNDRVGSGWGSLHLYGVGGDGPYVK